MASAFLAIIHFPHLTNQCPFSELIICRWLIFFVWWFNKADISLCSEHPNRFPSVRCDFLLIFKVPPAQQTANLLPPRGKHHSRSDYYKQLQPAKPNDGFRKKKNLTLKKERRDLGFETYAMLVHSLSLYSFVCFQMTAFVLTFEIISFEDDTRGFMHRECGLLWCWTMNKTSDVFASDEHALFSIINCPSEWFWGSLDGLREVTALIIRA